MLEYAIEIARSVESDLRKIPVDKHEAFFIEIENLTTNPFPESRYKKLKGTKHSYRLRVGNYRILYEVDSSERLITIYRIRHRKDSYTNL
ncbi:MAG: type II toxin-antitoxin system RelE/ParE family toxin [Bacteroidales bacterium]|nr:type II toxin-antitoxin system RelE/ParE family toxin [Bacteroidales bacterium]